jgi:Skp family chaperone for outer membrane proteins
MNIQKLMVIVLSLLFGLGVAMAAPVIGLDRAEVIVANHSPKAFQQGLKQAYGVVMMKQSDDSWCTKCDVTVE